MKLKPSDPAEGLRRGMFFIFLAILIACSTIFLIIAIIGGILNA